MRLLEFLEDDRDRLSLSRMLSFLSFWPASWVLLKIPTEGMLGIYLTAYGVGYLGGKGLDAMAARRGGGLNVDKPTD
jgi:hypothetical protein